MKYLNVFVRPLKMPRSSAFSLALAVVLLTATALRAADPAFVGVLALATDDAVAQRLGLSDEVKQQLRQLVEKRMNAATSIVLSIKDLPPEERARRLEPFVQESERLGMELLTIEQRSKLSQLKLQRTGMASLAQGDMAQLLELSPPQQAEIRRLLGERALAMTRGGEQESRAARDKYERSLRMLLTDAQKATWDQMAGLGPGPVKAAEPAKSDPQAALAGQEQPAAAAAEGPPAAAAQTPAVAESAEPAPPTQEMADPATAVPPTGDAPAGVSPTELSKATEAAPATAETPAPPTGEAAVPAAQIAPESPPAADAEMTPAVRCRGWPGDPRARCGNAHAPGRARSGVPFGCPAGTGTALGRGGHQGSAEGRQIAIQLSISALG